MCPIQVDESCNNPEEMTLLESQKVIHHKAQVTNFDFPPVLMAHYTEQTALRKIITGNIYSKTSLIRSDRDRKIGLRIIQFFYSGLAYRVFR
jgi:hypothetical protein